MKLSLQLNIVPTRRRLPPELFLNVYGFKGRTVKTYFLMFDASSATNTWQQLPLCAFYLPSPQKQAPARQTHLQEKNKYTLINNKMIKWRLTELKNIMSTKRTLFVFLNKDISNTVIKRKGNTSHIKRLVKSSVTFKSIRAETWFSPSVCWYL